MKNLYILLFLLITTLSCKSQTILTLGRDSSEELNQLPKPILIKDIFNIRDNFYGVWQGISGNNELTIYFYKVDDVPRQSLITDLFIDSLIGYYIYKENGVEIINSLSEAQSNNTPERARYAPIYGTPSDYETIGTMFFRDYNIEYQNRDGDVVTKKGISNFTIINNNVIQPQASFELRNYPNVLGPYNYDFSIPTSMVLTKIADTPPPLD